GGGRRSRQRCRGRNLTSWIVYSTAVEEEGPRVAVSGPWDHGFAGPAGGVSEAGRRGVGVGPCDPGIGRGRVTPEIRGVNHRVIRVVAVAPPDDQFISGPDGGVLKTRFGGVICLEVSPNVR